MGYADAEFVNKNSLPTRKLQRPIPVFNVDGSPNEAGAITEILDTILRFRDHSERIQLAVTQLGSQDIILGYGWLKAHNPEVDWNDGSIKLNRCPRHCSTCHEEVQKERKLSISTIHQQRRALERCCAGPAPRVIELDDDEDELDDLGPLGCDEFPDEATIEEGDRIFATTVPPEADFINATSTMSQQLAEAHAKISKDPRDGLPEHFYDYLDVFSKESFDVLPNRKPWDHAIELIPNSKPANCKVYPLAPNEQKALDEFLTENLS